MGRVETGMASFCKAPPSTEQLEQQQEDRLKLKQYVQKQRADKQKRAAETAKRGK